MSREAIVDKIVSDAENRANSFIEEQSQKAHDIFAEAAEQCRVYNDNFQMETDRMVADIDARSKSVAELEVKKLHLAARMKVLDDVFLRAEEKLTSLDGITLKKLLIGMLDEAEDGDTVVVGKRQAGALSKEDVDRAAAKRNISLSLSEEAGDFDGMIISGKGVDKNLTFDVEISLLRDSLEAQIAKEIFG